MLMIVAPYVGAWIETPTKVELQTSSTSHPTWVRGLKPKRKYGRYVDDKSHPTWVRGLKLQHQREERNVRSRTLRGCVD